MKDMNGKVAVVTGAGSGIGRALAQNLAARGAKLAICDMDAAGLSETEKSVAVPCLSRTVDVAQRDAVYSFAEAVIAEYGEVHMVFNNAGVALSETVEDMTYEDFQWVMDIDFWGVVYGTKAFLPHLKKQQEACVVNISSVFGLISVPTQSAYNAAKFAVRGFTEALRHELEIENSGVLAVCVHPGGIATSIAKNARFYKDPAGRTDKASTIDHFDQLARTTPEKAAATIIRGIEKNNPRVLIGTDAHIIDRVQRNMPIRYWSAVLSRFFNLQDKAS